MPKFRQEEGMVATCRCHLHLSVKEEINKFWLRYLLFFVKDPQLPVTIVSPHVALPVESCYYYMLRSSCNVLYPLFLLDSVDIELKTNLPR